MKPPLRLFVDLTCETVVKAGPRRALSPRIDAECLAGLAELGAALTVEVIDLR